MSTTTYIVISKRPLLSGRLKRGKQIISATLGMLNSLGETGVLNVKSNAKSGTITLLNGQPKVAMIKGSRESSGDSMAEEIATWEDGTFDFQDIDEITRSHDQIALGAAKKVDDARSPIQ